MTSPEIVNNHRGTSHMLSSYAMLALPASIFNSSVHAEQINVRRTHSVDFSVDLD